MKDLETFKFWALTNIIFGVILIFRLFEPTNKVTEALFEFAFYVPMIMILFGFFIYLVVKIKEKDMKVK